jgi:hypothetical protein
MLYVYLEQRRCRCQFGFARINIGGEVWNPDKNRPHSYRPITLAFSLNNPVAP